MKNKYLTDLIEGQTDYQINDKRFSKIIAVKVNGKLVMDYDFILRLNKEPKKSGRDKLEVITRE